MILLQAEVLELKANPDKLARGHVVEAKLDSGRGPVATVLVSEGTLHAGDPVVCGRALRQDPGDARRHAASRLEAAGPSIPVEILGLAGVPMAGDEFVAVADERAAKQISLHRMQKQRARDLTQASRPNLENLFERMKQGEVKELNLILKADVHGSIEALSDALTKLSNDEVKVNVIHAAVRHDQRVRRLARHGVGRHHHRLQRAARRPRCRPWRAEERVDMRFYNVIYDVINDVKSAMTGLMASRFEERFLGSRRGPRGVPDPQDRRHRRLLRDRRAARTRPQPAPGPRRCRGLSRARTPRCGASRTTSGRSRAATSAASGSRTSTTSRSATGSSSTTWRKSSLKWRKPLSGGR